MSCSQRRPVTASLMLCLALLLPGTLALGAGGFVVNRAATHLSEHQYWLDARVDYVFTDTALEALDNGVPLTIELRAQVRRKGAWIWEESLVDRRYLYTIRYQPLSELYQVAGLLSGNKRGFVTRDAAIAALGEIDDLPLVDASRIEPDERYLLRVKVSLDIEALPLPLRPVAYLKPSWKLSSGWTRWPLEP